MWTSQDSHGPSQCRCRCRRFHRPSPRAGSPSPDLPVLSTGVDRPCRSITLIGLHLAAEQRRQFGVPEVVRAADRGECAEPEPRVGAALQCPAQPEGRGTGPAGRWRWSARPGRRPCGTRAGRCPPRTGRDDGRSRPGPVPYPSASRTGYGGALAGHRPHVARDRQWPSGTQGATHPSLVPARSDSRRSGSEQNGSGGGFGVHVPEQAAEAEHRDGHRGRSEYGHEARPHPQEEADRLVEQQPQADERVDQEDQ